MNLIFEKGSLNRALQTMELASRNGHPILWNVCINAKTDTIECIATNLNIDMRINVPGIIRKVGSFTIPARCLANIVKKLPKEAAIEMSVVARNMVELRCGTGVYKLIGGFPGYEYRDEVKRLLAADKYPQLPVVESEPFTIKGETLRDMLTSTQFAAATEESRHTLNGLYFSLQASVTEVVATNGWQLALKQFDPCTAPPDIDGFILSLEAVDELIKAYKDAASVDVYLQENVILFSDGQTTLTARLVEGSYPTYHQIIMELEEAEGVIIVNRNALLSAIVRVSLLGMLDKPQRHSICIETQPGSGTIHISSPMGEALEWVKAERIQNAIRIGFNAQLLITTLTHLKSDSIRIKFKDSLSCVLIKPGDSDEHLCLVAPMRLKEVAEIIAAARSVVRQAEAKVHEAEAKVHEAEAEVRKAEAALETAQEAEAARVAAIAAAKESELPMENDNWGHLQNSGGER